MHTGRSDNRHTASIHRYRLTAHSSRMHALPIIGPEDADGGPAQSQRFVEHRVEATDIGEERRNLTPLRPSVFYRDRG